MTLNSKIRKIMLIFPPSTSLASWEPMVTTPMGIAYLAASLRQAGYEVTCLDAVCEDPYQEIPINDTISRYGLSYEQIMERIRAAQPDLVGISCIFSNQWPSVREIARRIKAMSPDLPVICGGAHPTFLSAMCMEDAPIDFILRGESEQTLLDFLDRFKAEKPVEDVDGLVWRDHGQIRENLKTTFIQDLDALPFPAHDLLNPEKYFHWALPMAYSFRSPRSVPIVSSRGCPCQCTFCSSTNLWGHRYRTRGAENVLAELDWLHDRFGIEEIKVQDDNLTINRERAKQIFTGMIERPYNLTWNTPNGIAVWTLDDELVGLMKKSGCYEVTLAIETGNQEVMNKIIHKPLKLEKAREVNRLVQKHGIVPTAYFIIGFPGETKAQIMDTVKFARSLQLETWALFIYNPLPGSKLFQECLERGFITEKSFFEEGNQYFSSVIDSDEWTSEELETIIRAEWVRGYLSIFRYPYAVILRYLLYLRYRPTFLKYFVVRSLRMLSLQLKKLTSPQAAKN